MRRAVYFVINSLENGGAERVVSLIASAIVAQADVTIITLKPGVFYPVDPRVRVYCLDPTITSPIQLLFRFPRLVWRLRSFLQKESFADGMSFLEIANFAHILARRGAKISFRTHHTFFTGVLGAVYRLWMRCLYPFSSHIFVNSEENRHDIAAFLWLPLSRVSTLYNPLDPESLIWASLPQDVENQSVGKRVFVTVGRLIPSKHHDVILRALGQYACSAGAREFVYYIVGDGPERERLERLAQQQGLTNSVIFLGRQKDVASFVSAADLFLYASTVEGFPNVLLEAAYLWTPIVTTDFVSGATEVVLGSFVPRDSRVYPIRGRHGIVLDPRSYQTDLVAFLLSDAVPVCGDFDMERYDITRIAHQYLQVFERE